MGKLKIGITVGDINGIGLEVILKTLNDERINNICTPLIYGSSKVVAYHKNIVQLDKFSFLPIKDASNPHSERINVLNCWQEDVNINLGQLDANGGKYAYIALDRATADLKAGLIDGLVTAPIHKKAMQMANFPYPGHTEFLEAQLEGKNLMLMVNDNLRVGLVTNHLPLAKVPEGISKSAVAEKIKIMNESLRMDFGIDKPTIAVLGLNPHAGDDGVLGTEEEKFIRPAVIEAKKKGILAMGPFPADGFFGSGQHLKFDGILAMYHDQGLVPFKALSFGNGVNFSAGLSGVRTSPDHGTGHDIAGKNMANPQSFRQALFLALDICRSRHDFKDSHANALVKKQRHSKEDVTAGTDRRLEQLED